MPNELKPCPFCGGEAKLSAKDHLFGGYNGVGQSRREYLIKAICNKCKARGPVFATGWVNTTYDCYKQKESSVSEQDKALLSAAEAKAISTWNRRTKE
jgi:Lar family restriction alleviation protein